MPQYYVTDGFNRFFHKCQQEGWNNPERPMLVRKVDLAKFLPELEKAVNGEPLGSRNAEGSTYDWLQGGDTTTCIETLNENDSESVVIPCEKNTILWIIELHKKATRD